MHGPNAAAWRRAGAAWLILDLLNHRDALGGLAVPRPQGTRGTPLGTRATSQETWLGSITNMQT